MTDGIQRSRRRNAVDPVMQERQQETAPAPASEALGAALTGGIASPAEPIMERHEMRKPLREENPRDAAERRAREILEHTGGSIGEGTDEFYFDRSIIPDGWDYEWKRRFVLNAADPAYDVELARTGWKEVPSSRHPEMMPPAWRGNTIERKGMVLMERPAVISDMVRKNDLKRARDQVRFKEEQLSNAPQQGHFPRSNDADGDPRTRPSIKKSFEPMEIPDDK